MKLGRVVAFLAVFGLVSTLGADQPSLRVTSDSKMVNVDILAWPFSRVIDHFQPNPLPKDGMYNVKYKNRTSLAFWATIDLVLDNQLIFTYTFFIPSYTQDRFSFAFASPPSMRANTPMPDKLKTMLAGGGQMIDEVRFSATLAN
ncbi:MAG: hypothetical protein A3G41_00680 [Elusimicrobia bacterium RIFCSPLOWO2_12_FULL_59_9]|nr:MAG: hypothetical protein A3G41_00680 [Elusimicrobia bacterium RIFCSPLOWO2_12_FULL_59_9]